MEIPLQVRRTLFNEENIYYNLLSTVYYYNYILFIFSQVKYTNTTRDGRIQGERSRSGASFLQALTRLNFFDFQKFEYHYFNDFSIVIDNSPESNGYIFLSMTRKFWRFSTLDQPWPRLRAHRDPPHTSSRIFPLLFTSLTYCEIRTIRRHFCDAIHAYAAAQNSFIHSCMI